MNDQFKLGDIRGEVKSINCLKSFHPETPFAANALPVNQNLGYFGISVKKTKQHPYEHAFKNVWERNIEIRPQVENGQVSVPNTSTINWKQWPPPLPEFQPGITIPIEFKPQIDLKLSQTGLWREVETDIQATPAVSQSYTFFQNKHGRLNTPQCQTFSVEPPSILFLNSDTGTSQTITLKLKNVGDMSRRIRVFPPITQNFEVFWGSELNERTLISPGLTTRVAVHRKAAADVSINDMLTILVEGDGALVVPILTSNTVPPIIETTEWDCGCSIVGNERKKAFEIKNLGGNARFWILTEEDFRKEHLAVVSDYEKRIGKASAVTRRYNCMPERKAKYKFDQIYTRCFRIYPSCFRLQRNQKATIRVSFTPKASHFHYQKLAILCDNGEVRWIAVRGMGLVAKSPGLLDIKGNWSAPPCDLPTDYSTNFIIDCGDLTVGETAQPTFTIINKSCIPLYFFWCIRPIQSFDGLMPTNLEKNMLLHHIEGSLMVEWQDYDNRTNFERNVTPSGHIKVYPAQGIIGSNQEIVCTVLADCPEQWGYHSGVLSLFVEQVNEAAMALIKPIIEGLTLSKANDIPIYYEDLLATMPRTHHNHQKNSESGAGADEFPEGIHHRSKHKKHHHHHNDVTENVNTRQQGKRGSRDGLYPIYLMKRKNTLGSTLKLERLKLHDDEPVREIEVIEGTETNLEEFEEYQRNAAKEAAQAAAALAKNPVGMYQQLIEQQRQLQEKQLAKEAVEEDDNAKTELTEAIDEPNQTIRSKSLSEKKVSNASAVDGPEEQEDDIALEITRFVKNCIESPSLWLKSSSALQPIKEVEIWLRSIPLQCWFYPPCVVAKGVSGSQIERSVQFHNQSKYRMDFEWEPFMDEICCIDCYPQRVSVKPNNGCVFQLILQLQKPGNLQRMLLGTLRLPYTIIPCTLSVDITTSGARVEVLTPLLSFGLVAFGTEKVKSLAFKNTGNKKCKWRVKVAEEPLDDENNNIIGRQQPKIVSGKLLRVWPEWGVLDPGETAGAQVYFSPEIYGKFASSLEVTTDDNTTLTTFVTVCGEVQSPCLFLENGFFSIPLSSFDSETSVYTSSVNVVNPTGFYLAFSWQCPIGRQRKNCTIEVEPKIGFVAPKGNTECRITVTNLEGMSLHNVFVPCCVEGMKEPLILKVFTTKH